MTPNEIANLVLKVVFFILIVFIVPIIKRKYSQDQIDSVIQTIHTYVEAAEQVFAIDQGTEKKEWVQKKLLEAGIDINLDIIDAEIEGYVLLLHNMLKGE